MSDVEKEVTESSPYSESQERATVETTVKPRFPSWMLTLTAVYIATVCSAFLFASELDDRFAVGLDVVTVAAMFGGMALLVLWVGWILIRSRWSWKAKVGASAAVLLVPFLMLKIFRPVLGGDVTIQRFEPIWQSKPEIPLTDLSLARKVDLTTETPDDFARFLGPNQNSTVTTGIQIDAENLANAKVLWKHAIGEGWAGFVARNGFAVTIEQRERMECVTCYDINDGKMLWIKDHPVRHRDTLNLGRIGPRATPLIHEGRVYSVGAVGQLMCLNGADGTLAWEVDLNELLGIELGNATDGDGQTVTYESNTRLSWGRSGAPLIVDDLLIILGGGPKDGPIVTLLAFDRLTGELRWKGGKEMIAYGSPTLANVAGVDQILLTAETLAMGFDPRTGEQLWEFPRPGETDGAANTSQLSVVGPNRVLTSKGYPDGGGELIELTATDGKLVPKSVWSNHRSLKTKLMSPIIHDGHAYSLSNGFLECCRLSDGERIWKHRGHFGHGQMLLVGNEILLHSEGGELFMFPATPDGPEELGRIKTIDGVCWNTLCLYGNKLLVRSEIEAACLELPTR